MYQGALAIIIRAPHSEAYLLLTATPPTPQVSPKEICTRVHGFCPFLMERGRNPVWAIEKNFFPHSPLIPYAPGNSLKMQNRSKSVMLVSHV